MQASMHDAVDYNQVSITQTDLKVIATGTLSNLC